MGCSVYTKPKECPQSCDDKIQCTIDSCGKWTNFECRHELEDCNDYNPCTIDSCSIDKGNCIHKINENITPCCGNGICESTEDYSNCQKDCQLRKGDCIKTDGIRFKYIHSLCKDYQILECKKSALCFLFLAEDYNDAKLCDYIKYPDTDWFWYCKARLDYGKSACSYIDDAGILEDCLKYAK